MKGLFQRCSAPDGPSNHTSCRRTSCKTFCALVALLLASTAAQPPGNAHRVRQRDNSRHSWERHRTSNLHESGSGNKIEAGAPAPLAPGASHYRQSSSGTTSRKWEGQAAAGRYVGEGHTREGGAPGSTQLGSGDGGFSSHWHALDSGT
eukprot:CAMPEP_0117690402 /NCGR_PEP_ID=MMETSP0804-20121206/25104_1 /TAXON_ID=1074897 /ORGANISM="Tetraselmis astigmatica, Strain CCMP880" /LENGTH=148 /DNA_ID=CAMNT_0005503439 /DNA_START=42 /DNA_END=485 /DNA_ORIENTATION=-